MLGLIGFAILVAIIIWFLPLLFALGMTILAVAFCLIMAAICWVKETFTPTKKIK